MTRKKVMIFLSLVTVMVSLGFFYKMENNSPILSQKQVVKADADWVDHYNDLSSMVNKADVVVIGKVIGSKLEKRVDLIFTKQDIAIEKSLKGNLTKGDIIEVLQTGGELDGIKTPEIYDTPLFKKNDKLLLFLSKSSEGHYLVLGGYQGKGKIVNNQIMVEDDQDKVGKELKDKNIDDMNTQILDLINK